jgi:hypothetical protein
MSSVTTERASTRLPDRNRRRDHPNEVAEAGRPDAAGVEAAETDT